MVININNLGHPVNSGSQSGKADVAASPQQKSGDSATAEKTPDGSQVELSSQASTLKTAEEKIQSLPEVDSDRVASIKAALEKGDFKIDNQSLADKMLATDALLGQ